MRLIDRAFHQALRYPLLWNLGYKTQKRQYRAITRRFSDDGVVFLNYGYEEDPPMGLPLDVADEPDRYPIQLYQATAIQADLAGKQVLEVGCGHGGGASYLTRAQRPASYVGLDLNPDAIAFNRDRHKVAGLEFVEGDAQNLPFGDESFDVVVNVESSIHYPHFMRFLEEVTRVLRPGGHFLYADGRFREHIPSWEEALAVVGGGRTDCQAPMRTLSQRDISADVARGITQNTRRWQAILDRHKRRAGCQMVEGSMIHRALCDGTFSYRVYHMTKPC